MEDAPRMFGNHDLMTSWCHLWYNLYSAASIQPTLVVNPQIELASSSSENEESLCQEDIQKLLGLQVWGDFIWVENTIILEDFLCQGSLVSLDKWDLAWRAASAGNKGVQPSLISTTGV